jgi:hypothetical protein
VPSPIRGETMPPCSRAWDGGCCLRVQVNKTRGLDRSFRPRLPSNKAPRPNPERLVVPRARIAPGRRSTASRYLLSSPLRGSSFLVRSVPETGPFEPDRDRARKFNPEDGVTLPPVSDVWDPACCRAHNPAAGSSVCLLKSTSVGTDLQPRLALNQASRVSGGIPARQDASPVGPSARRAPSRAKGETSHSGHPRVSCRICQDSLTVSLVLRACPVSR